MHFKSIFAILICFKPNTFNAFQVNIRNTDMFQTKYFTNAFQVNIRNTDMFQTKYF